MTDTFNDLWRELLPDDVHVEAGAILAPPTDASGSLPMVVLSSDRQSEFYSGRHYAKKALALFEVHEANLAAAVSGGPIWPKGYVGSITHTRKASIGFCAAAVARAGKWRAIGIDAEFTTTIAPRLWPSILTENELTQVMALPLDTRDAEVTQRWCVKEAAIKATQIPFEPLNIETVERGAGRYGFTSTKRSNNDLQVRTALQDGVVCAAVMIPI